MSEVPEAAAQRAARLLRWYPRDWRSRYGEEFAELLIADLIERPHSRRRHADVAISGMVARLIPTGLAGHAIDPADQVRASLASLGCLTGVFLSCGVALWSQLTVGWPGTGGHPWAHQGLVPGGVAACMWASTLWVSPYWAHPGGLALFPAPSWRGWRPVPSP